MPDSGQSSNEMAPAVHVGLIKDIYVYQVKEGEMVQIENRPTVSIYFTFTTFLLSIAVAFLIALLTITIESEPTYCFSL